MRKRYDPYPEDDPSLQEEAPYDNDDVNYTDYTVDGFETDEEPEYDDEIDNSHRFHIAMNVFNLISILAGLAVILVLVSLLISLVTWLQSDISQSLTLLTSNLQ